MDLHRAPPLQGVTIPHQDKQDRMSGHATITEKVWLGMRQRTHMSRRQSRANHLERARGGEGEGPVAEEAAAKSKAKKESEAVMLAPGGTGEGGGGGEDL